jgi:hypothetical protein
MTQTEWIEVVQYIQAQWPHSPVPDESLAAWYGDVEDIPAGDVMAATRALARGGREFPPNGGIIRKKAVELAFDAPEWAEVLRWATRYFSTGVTNPFYGQGNYRGKGSPDHPSQKARALLLRMPPLAAAFIEWLGHRQLREAFEQEGGGEARLRDKWVSWQRRGEREAGLIGLDSGLAQVRRINDAGPRRLSGAITELARQLNGPDFDVKPIEGSGDAA